MIGQLRRKRVFSSIADAKTEEVGFGLGLANLERARPNSKKKINTSEMNNDKPGEKEISAP